MTDDDPHQPIRPTDKRYHSVLKHVYIVAPPLRRIPMWWLILQSLMFWLCSPPIVFAVLVANSRWQFTKTMIATVLGLFTAAVVTGTITNYVLGVYLKQKEESECAGLGSC